MSYVKLLIDMVIETGYVRFNKIDTLPRVPLEGSLDLTYRCNNNCRHCWLKVQTSAEEEKKELSFEEIKKIVNEAKGMGCHRWSISGGEPLYRKDFSEIFDYITRENVSYKLNTNGALITPQIARLLKRKGVKLIAIYGATAKTHDHITRNPGSFEATIQGFRYLKEAGAGFTVQIVPMKDNHHEFQDMIDLAETLSKNYRIGASWLYLSALGDQKINEEIMRQRLSPEDVVGIDKPDLSYEENNTCSNVSGNGHFFSACISHKRDFHIDPYGGMSFCSFVKDPDLRYDLRNGTFKDAWEDFIPGLENRIETTKEYSENCASCELRADCRICPVHSYLEHRNFSQKIDYLCKVAQENKRFKEDWIKNHRRYYNIAGVTIRVDSDQAINDATFDQKFKSFEGPGIDKDIIAIRHHFGIPDLDLKDLGEEVYRRPPWAIYKKDNSWIYLGISSDERNKKLHQVSVFNKDHTRCRIYTNIDKAFFKGSCSLTFFPTDQILLARALADKDAAYIHASGVILDGKGLAFVGHSEAGKSTMVKMLKDKANILCDDRIIIRKKSDGFRIYGTWSHGEVRDVSNNSSPLKAILFLNKSNENRMELIKDPRAINRKLLPYLIKPLTTIDWWEKMLLFTEKISCEVPCYSLYFDKSGKVLELLRKEFSHEE